MPQEPLLQAWVRQEDLDEAFRKFIPPFGAAGNPVDITAQAVHSGGLQTIVGLLEQSDDIDVIVVVVSLASETRIPVKREEIKPLIDAQRKPILFFTYTLPSQFARTELAASGIVAFPGITALGRAVSHLVRQSRFKFPGRGAPELSESVSSLRSVPEKLSEHESKLLLQETGIAVPPGYLIRDRSQLASALSGLMFPVAMKIQSRDIPHKSEAGGVRVNVRDLDEAAAACSPAASTLSPANPPDRVSPSPISTAIRTNSMWCSRARVKPRWAKSRASSPPAT